MVVPPPGVSSIVSSPPMASVKPRAMARPRPTPVPWSTRRWNGWNTSSRVRRPVDAGAAVDDPDVAPVRRRRRPRRAAACSAREGDGVVDEVGDDAARAAPGRRSPSAGPRAAPGSTSRGPRPEPGRRARHDLLERGLPAGSGGETPGLEAAHVEQRVDEGGEAVGLVLDGGEELVGLLAASQRMSVWRRLVMDALIDASGVRRSCETAWSRPARRSLACASSVRSGGLGLEPARLEARAPPGRRARRAAGGRRR